VRFDAEARDAVFPQQERSQIAGVVETALGHHDPFARQETLPWRRETFETFVVLERLEVRRHVNRLASREQPVATVIKPHNLLGPLYADVEHSIAFSEGFGIVPAARGQRPAIGSKHRCDFGVGDSGRPAITIDKPPG
jgi:hypothetical protein